MTLRLAVGVGVGVDGGVAWINHGSAAAYAGDLAAGERSYDRSKLVDNWTAFDPRAIWRTLAVATLVAGTLDMAGAMVPSALQDRGPVKVLQSIAGAILGKSARAMGLRSAVLGLAIHFAIMSAMVMGFIATASRVPLVLREPLVSGAAYGLFLYGVMYLIVLPLRWPSLFPISDKATIIGQLLCHVLLVGLPVAFTATALLFAPDGR